MNSTLLRCLLPALLVACGAGRAGPPAAGPHGIHDHSIRLSGDPATAEADAAILHHRIEQWGFEGTARATKGEIELLLRFPSGVSPDRLVGRLLRPGRLGVYTEVAPNSNHITLRDCPGPGEPCLDIAVGPAHLGSEHIAEVSPLEDPMGGPAAVLLVFNDAGQRRLAQLGEQLVGHRLVIGVDDEVVAAPLLSEPLLGDRAVIHLGRRGVEEPAEAYALAERIAGPALAATWVRSSP